jgi:NADPH:quinone reductase-like Zn-dependent oxidoreductase
MDKMDTVANCRDKVIDYTIHTNLYAHLTEMYGETPLDAVIDCVGDDPLYHRSPAYLAPKGKFICIVGGGGKGVRQVLMNEWRPTMLGGTPRSYRLLGLMPTGTLAREVKGWVDDGLLGEVPIDSTYPFDKAIEAYERLATKRATGKVVVTI